MHACVCVCVCVHVCEGNRRVQMHLGCRAIHISADAHQLHVHLKNKLFKCACALCSKDHTRCCFQTLGTRQRIPRKYEYRVNKRYLRTVRARRVVDAMQLGVQGHHAVDQRESGVRQVIQQRRVCQPLLRLQGCLPQHGNPKPDCLSTFVESSLFTQCLSMRW